MINIPSNGQHENSVTDIATWHELVNASLPGGGTIYSSSGSTGASKSLLYTPDVFRGAIRRTRALFEMLDVQRNDKVAILWGYGLFPPAQFYTAALGEMGYRVMPLGSGKNLSTETKISILSDSPVEVLIGMPSYLLKVGQDLQNSGLLMQTVRRLRFIIAGGEVLDSTVREALQRLYGVQVYDHYGMLQAPMIAGECKEQVMHISSDYLPEILKDDHSIGAEGSGILLLSSAIVWQPLELVRLKTNDLVELQGSTCECGSTLPTVSIRGRSDFIMKVRGQQVDFLTIFQTLREAGIDNYYFEVLKNPTDIITLHHAQDVAAKTLETRLNSLINVSYEIVEEPDFNLPLTSTGKAVHIIFTKLP